MVRQTEQGICRKAGLYNFKKLPIRETYRFQFYKIEFFVEITVLLIKRNKFSKQFCIEYAHCFVSILIFKWVVVIVSLINSRKVFPTIFDFTGCSILVNDTSNKETNHSFYTVHDWKNSISSSSEVLGWIHYT